MEPSEQTKPSTKHERWLLRKQEKEAERQSVTRTKRWRRISIWTISLLVLGAGIGWLVWKAANVQPIPESDIVAKRGLHWHPQLAITINGQDVPISHNIGIGAVHNPIHTHEDPPVIHLEFSGLVTKNDLRLNRFFQAWGKQFTSTCILDSCNGQEGTVRMLVNGQPNDEFEQYIMRDQDKIAIRFE